MNMKIKMISKPQVRQMVHPLLGERAGVRAELLAPIGLLLLGLTGCAHLMPGADPIVVRAEQTETVAKATFDTFERIDDANRSFFKTNAPALHNFAEYLRAPVVVNGTNLLPRGLAFVVSLDATKLAYKQGRASSNVLVTAIAVLETAVIQAQTHISQQQPITK